MMIKSSFKFGLLFRTKYKCNQFHHDPTTTAHPATMMSIKRNSIQNIPNGIQHHSYYSSSSSMKIKMEYSHYYLTSSSSSSSSWSLFLKMQKRFYSPRVLDVNKVIREPILVIKQFLRYNNVEFEEGYACLVINLPKHVILHDFVPPNKWDEIKTALTQIFIDKQTYDFLCPELSLLGDWRTFQSFIIEFNKFRRITPEKEGGIESASALLLPLSPIHIELDEENKKFFYSYPSVSDISPTEFKELLKHFKIPITTSNLKPNDFDKFQVRIDIQNKTLLFPVMYSKRIVGLKKVQFGENGLIESNITSIMSKDNNNQRLIPLLHGLDGISKYTKSIVLVSSVLDSLILKATKNDLVPITLSNGISSLPPEHLPYLESVHEILIWFPNDSSLATDNALSFGKKLVNSRCKIMSREFPNPLNCLKLKNVSLINLIQRHFRPCSHEYIATFDDLREGVYLEMLNYEKCQGIKWKRFENLNETLRGFRRGELTVFSGRTGSGKTTFISEYSLDLCMQGVNTLWGSFEVKNVRLAKMQLKQFSLENFEKPEVLENFDHWANKFQKLPIYYLTFHGSQQIKLVLDAMLHAVYVYDIGHVIIDNIQFMMGMKGIGDRFNQQDIIIELFRKFATAHNVHVTLVIHPRKDDEELLTTNSIFGGAKATQEADNVIILQTENMYQTKQNKFLQIMKNRFSGDLGSFPLYFNKETLTFNKKTYIRDKTKKKTPQSIINKSEIDASTKDKTSIPHPPGREN